MYIELAIFAVFVFCYSVVAGRVERAATSGPIVFVVAGFLMGPLGLAWFDGSMSRNELRMLADLTLALILFIDAANADLAVLKRQYRIPSRMLLLGPAGCHRTRHFNRCSSCSITCLCSRRRSWAPCWPPPTRHLVKLLSPIKAVTNADPRRFEFRERAERWFVRPHPACFHCPGDW